MTNTQRLPKGDKFMPNVSVKQLNSAIRKEKNANAHNRLRAALKRKEGMTLRQIEAVLDKSFGMIGKWLHRMHRMGLAGRYHDMHPGAACKLKPERLVELKKDLIAGPIECGFESGMWTAPMVIAHVYSKFDIKYKSSGMEDLLHRMGFSWRKARPRHTKAASEEEKEKYKKKLHSWLPNTNAGDTQSWHRMSAPP